MTVDEALNLLCCSKAELGRLLNIDRSNISLWNEKIPLAREYQIRDLAEGKTPLTDQKRSKQKSTL